jgi:hypothetical protein
MKFTKRLAPIVSIGVLLSSLVTTAVAEDQDTPILLSYTDGIVAGDYPYKDVTHYCWAFAGVTQEGGISIPNEDRVPEFIDSVKAHGNSPLLSLGGAKSISKFKIVMTTEATMLAYIDTLLAYVLEKGFVGVEINWEGEELLTWNGLAELAYPNFKEAYSHFAITLGQQLHAEGLTLGVDVYGGDYFAPAYPDGSDPLYTATIDRMLIMTGGAHGKWEIAGGAKSVALPPSPPSLMEEHAQAWADRGIPKEKIIISYVSGFYGYCVRGAQAPAKLYSAIGTSASDGLGNTFYKDIYTYENDPSFTQYGGGSRGSYLYNPMNEENPIDDELIFYNTPHDLEWFSNKSILGGYGGIGYWLPRLDLGASDPNSLVHAIVRGMQCDTAINEPAYIDQPKLPWSKPQGEKIDLSLESAWVTKGTEDVIKTVKFYDDSVVGKITVPSKDNGSHWPVGSISMVISDTVKGIIDNSIDTIMIMYKSNQSMVVFLGIDSANDENLTSHLAVIPSTLGEVDTINIAIEDFMQPEWRNSTIERDLDSLFAVSFCTYYTYGKTTDIVVFEVNGYKSEKTAIKSSVLSKQAGIVFNGISSNKISFSVPQGGSYTTSLYSLNGREIFSSTQDMSANVRANVSTPNFKAKGVYVVSITGMGTNLVQKVVIK